MLKVTNLTKIVVLVGIAALACVPVLRINQFWIFFVTQGLIFTMLLASLNLLIGYAGLVNLGQMALFGFGGFATAYFTSTHGWPIGLGLLLGTAFGASAGLLLAIPAYRARAIYFGIITLAFVQLTFETADKWRLLGGGHGFPNVPGLGWHGRPVSGHAYYWFVLGAFVLGLAVLQQLSSSGLGRTFIAIRENESAAASLGIGVLRAKATALGISGALAGLAGALATHLTGNIFAQSLFNLSDLRLFVAFVVGGAGFFAGPIVGSGITLAIGKLTDNLVTAQPIIFGLILITSLAVMRLGIVGLVFINERLRTLFLRLPDLDAEMMQAAGQPIEALVSPGDGQVDGTLLRVTEISKRFGGVQALDGVSLEVDRGAIHGLIGPNGSGKSTFVNLVTGFIPRDRGRIEFAGREINTPKPHVMAKQGLVRIFQRAETFGRLLVIQNVLMGLHLRSDTNLVRCMLPLRGRRARERRLAAEALAILNAVGLGHRALTPVAVLPYGEQRLLEIARAVAARPRLLILDEPATGLTSGELERLGEVLRTLRRGGLTLLVIEHNMEFLMGLVDRVTVLDYGREIAQGLPEQVQSNPEVIEAYLGEEVAV